jgi:CrcB protein
MLKNSALRAPLAISLGAIAGALSRYYLGGFAVQLWGAAFPYGTLLINLSGCFGMGLFTALFLKRIITAHPDVQLLLTTGFLGAYTTFSTYGLDAAKLIEWNLEMGTVYWVGSALFGFGSFQLGTAVVEFIQHQMNHDRCE